MVDKMNAAMHRNFLNRPFEIDAGTTYFTMRLKLSIKSMERCTCFKLLLLPRLFLGYAGALATLHHMTVTEFSQLRGFLWHHAVQRRNEVAKNGTLDIRPREEQRSNQVAICCGQPCEVGWNWCREASANSDKRVKSFTSC